MSQSIALLTAEPPLILPELQLGVTDRDIWQNRFNGFRRHRRQNISMVGKPLKRFIALHVAPAPKLKLWENEIMLNVLGIESED